MKLKCNWAGDRKSVWHFGYFFLSLPGSRPDDADYVTWCRFNERGGLVANTIPAEDLLRILCFDLNPDTLEPLELRRHHKTRHLIEMAKAPLGFFYPKIVTRKS